MRNIYRTILLALCIAIVAHASAESRAERLLNELRNPSSEYVFVTAHRGDWRNFPENSLQGIESAIKMGVDIVEVDVHRTADGHLVVCHDKTINRTTNGKGKIAELTLDSIRRCSLRAGHNHILPKYKMPTLDEVLDLCRGRVLINIDKGYNYYDQIMTMLRKRDMVEQVVIKGSKSPATVAKTMANHKQNMLYMPIINYTSKRWERHKVLFEEYLACPLPLVAYEICWDGTLSGERRIFERVLRSGVRLWVNTLWDSICGGEKHGFEDDRAIGNEEKIYGELLKMGVTMIQTDRPQLLLNYLNSKGRHSLQ
ncbi:MAG: glycerophosphodiester phosphodiesterase family protein [Alistipes sp.]|nr:glycerophosphodiester phosphodiesterase family protein [Alistipes sp.]